MVPAGGQITAGGPEGGEPKQDANAQIAASSALAPATAAENLDEVDMVEDECDAKKANGQVTEDAPRPMVEPREKSSKKRT